jgi:uncharacterized protein
VTRSLVLSGAGPYADAWHDFAATSPRLASILAGVGHDVEITEDIPGRLLDLAGVDLLVVNATEGPTGDGGVSARTALDEFLARGGGILAVHVGVCRLLDVPSWSQITGAGWMRGQTMHPPIDRCRVDVSPLAHPIAARSESFELFDERYSHLDLGEGNTVFATHQHDGRAHPLLWARASGGSRVVSDVLGHGVESYDCAEHRALIARSAQWLTRNFLDH